MNLILPRAAVKTATAVRSPQNIAARILQAAPSIASALSKGTAIDARTLREAMESAFGGSDAEGLWTWKTCLRLRLDDPCLFEPFTAALLPKIEDGTAPPIWNRRKSE